MAVTLFEKLRQGLRGEIRRQEPLSLHTTWRVGGEADLFVVPADRADLGAALALLAGEGAPWMVIGAGSNLLVRDGGIEGAVIHLGKLRRLDVGPGAEVTAEGGLPLMALIRACAERGLAGLEGLAGIPGTVGGGLWMNAGACGQEMADVVSEATLAGPAGEEIWPAARLGFGYRRSAIGERVVVEAKLRLTPADPARLQEEIRAKLLRRREAQGVGLPNAGSVFKNPPGEQAWRLIDQAGLRGASVGGARVSEKHANFIVNAGGATAEDILSLMEEVRRKVEAKTGVVLEPEVRIVGRP